MVLPRKLEVILHSANDLYDVKHFGTMNPYATIWIAGGGMQVSKTCTTDVAKKAGSWPVWNHPMVFNVNPLKKDCILFCELQHDGPLLKRKIGEVQIPLTEFLAGDGSSKIKVSYPVKTTSGEVKGEIVLSYKLLEPGVTKDGSGTSKKEGSSGNLKGVKKDSIPKKKKDGFMKNMAKNVAVSVASKVVMIAGVAVIASGAALFAEGETGNDEHPEGQAIDGNQAGDQAVDGNQAGDQAVDENQVEDQTVDADEDADVDQDEDGYDNDEDGYDDGDDYGDDLGF